MIKTGRMTPSGLSLLLLLGMGCAGAASHVNAQDAHEQGAALAVLDLDLDDTSLQAEIEGNQPEDVERAQATTQQVSRMLDASKAFEVVDSQPAADLIETMRDRYRFLKSCNGCELDIAKALGSDYVLVGWVQKVSNLILNMNMVVREVASGDVVLSASADMRGDTDKSWSRAADSLVERLVRGYKDLPSTGGKATGAQ